MILITSTHLKNRNNLIKVIKNNKKLEKKELIPWYISPDNKDVIVYYEKEKINDWWKKIPKVRF